MSHIRSNLLCSGSFLCVTAPTKQGEIPVSTRFCADLHMHVHNHIHNYFLVGKASKAQFSAEKSVSSTLLALGRSL